MSTLKDVAKEAGVSVATVSRYLNDTAKLTGATRASVKRAVDALGFRPNRVARRLRISGGRALLIGLVVPDLRNPFFADVARGVETTAQRWGSAVIVGHSDESEALERMYLDLLGSESVDGIVLPTVQQGVLTARDLAPAGIPVVCVDRRPGALRVDTVVSDNEAGARAATDHLLRLGHRRIGFVEGLPTISTSRERLAGYRQALAAAGVAADKALVRIGDSRQCGGRDRAGALLDLDRPPTALVVGNNLMTLGALEAVHERGLRIPDDVAIVGYDDMPWSAAFNPPLTCVSQPGFEMGQRAAELLMRRIEHPDAAPELVVLQPRLVVRASCGAGRRAGNGAAASGAAVDDRLLVAL